MGESERMLGSSAHLFRFSGYGCPTASAEHFPHAINEQTDVQIANRDKETDWEEVRHAHTYTRRKTHTQMYTEIQSCLFLVVQKQERLIFGY